MVQSCMRDLTGELRYQTLIGHSLVQLCVCMVQARTYITIFGVQISMTTKLTYLMTAYYASSDSFTANDALFYKNKFA